MKTILAIETVTTAISVALHIDGKDIDQYYQAPQQHTKRLVPMVNEILHQASITLKDVACLAVGFGPGSFTGIRIGVGWAQAVGYGLDIPIYPVSTLLILAEGAKHEAKGRTIIPVMDARMGQYYANVFAHQAGMLTPLFEDKLYEQADIDALKLAFPDAYWLSITTLPQAKHLLAIAKQRVADGISPVCAQALRPHYIRHKVADKPSKSFHKPQTISEHHQ